MKQKNALESGFCTALRCRVFVRNGDGNQFVDEKKEIQRYCWRCWQLYFISLSKPKSLTSNPSA